jgi:hypothetical protein
LVALLASCAPRGAPLDCDPASTELAVGYQGICHLPLEQDGAQHRVWLRDALPHEDARGIVRAP